MTETARSGQYVRMVVAITGASAGIGRACVREFAARGYDVGLIARGRDRLDAAAAEVREAGRRACVAPADVADADAVEAAAREIEEELGEIDVGVNVAKTPVLDGRQIGRSNGGECSTAATSVACPMFAP